MRTSDCSCLVASLLILMQMPMASLAQPPAATKQPPKARPAVAAPKSAQPAARAVPAVRPKSEPEVLTEDSVIKLVAAGLDEEVVIAKIKSSQAKFTLDTDSLIRLKNAKVSGAVVRAMLNWKAPGTATPAAPAAPAAPAPVVERVVPAVVPAAPVDTVIVRQGLATFPLSDRPQTVLFIKSEAGTAKAAILDLVLGDVGIQLLTMGLAPGLMMWNPYLSDTMMKAAKLGKNMLLNKNGDTKGFEIETLTGATAEVTLKEGKAELLIPINRYLPSADSDPATFEPVVLKMQPRDNEQRRVLSARKVLLKQSKKGRFDLKPTTERMESDVEQSIVPSTIERMPDNIIKITTNEDLKRGEYALVFRRKDASSAYTGNVPLKPTPRQASVSEEASPFAGMPGMTPEQMQAMQQMQQGGQPPRGGMLGMGRRAPAAPPTPPQGADGSMAGFLAWDFRVLP